MRIIKIAFEEFVFEDDDTIRKEMLILQARLKRARESGDSNAIFFLTKKIRSLISADYLQDHGYERLAPTPNRGRHTEFMDTNDISNILF